MSFLGSRAMKNGLLESGLRAMNNDLLECYIDYFSHEKYRLFWTYGSAKHTVLKVHRHAATFLSDPSLTQGLCKSALATLVASALTVPVLLLSILQSDSKEHQSKSSYPLLADVVSPLQRARASRARARATRAWARPRNICARGGGRRAHVHAPDGGKDGEPRHGLFPPDGQRRDTRRGRPPMASIVRDGRPSWQRCGRLTPERSAWRSPGASGRGPRPRPRPDGG
jgi:hypothetical protein